MYEELFSKKDIIAYIDTGELFLYDDLMDKAEVIIFSQESPLKNRLTASEIIDSVFNSLIIQNNKLTRYTLDSAIKLYNPTKKRKYTQRELRKDTVEKIHKIMSLLTLENKPENVSDVINGVLYMFVRRFS